MPERSSRDRVRPKPGPKRKSPIAAASSSLRRLAPRSTLSSAEARSTASFWEKCTTYTGALSCSTSRCSRSPIGSIAYSHSKGTGRTASSTTATSRPVRSRRSRTKKDTSPSVADMSTICACGSSSSGTCQAQPRWGSA